tara:strand:+ start:370 stop:588 length:219 start_codon:yes stop_codon:yes gene_type:complete
VDIVYKVGRLVRTAGFGIVFSQMDARRDGYVGQRWAKARMNRFLAVWKQRARGFSDLVALFEDFLRHDEFGV